jgi:hypothetical protein
LQENREPGRLQRDAHRVKLAVLCQQGQRNKWSRVIQAGMKWRANAT